jgi:hypothetical protein
MILRPQTCFLASDNCTISEKRGVIGSQHGESLCLLLVEVKIIMSTLNNNGINLSITTPHHRIGAVGVGVAGVQPPPVQCAAPPHRPSRRRRRHASPPFTGDTGEGRGGWIRRGGEGSVVAGGGGVNVIVLVAVLATIVIVTTAHRHLRHDLRHRLRNRRRRRLRCGGGGGGRRVFVNFVVTAPVCPFGAVGLAVLLEDS